MANHSLLKTDGRKSENITRMQILYSVDQQQEDEWMIRYTRIYTYELVFAVDLMSFVFEENNQIFENLIYPECLGRSYPSDFDDFLKKFIKLTLTKFKVNAVNMLEKNLNLDEPCYSEFKAYANASALKVESSSYSEYAFLLFCVIIAQMCTVAHMHGIFKAPDFGIMLMCRTYSNFRDKGALPGDVWSEIKRIARDTAELLELEAQRSTDRNV